MGFYLGFRVSRMPPGGIERTITAGEYCRVMGDVLRELHDHGGLMRVRYQPAVCSLRMGRFAEAVEGLADLVRQTPEDQVARRLLGLAHLAQRNLHAATVHLEVAYRLLKRERAVGGTLRASLRVQYEEALVRYLLVPVYLELGRREDARVLVAEGQGL